MKHPSMGKLIFFVDDDKMILNLVEYTLNNRQDYEIKTFISGKDCLRNLQQDPDLVVLDLDFRENGEEAMSGLEILRNIRKTHSDLPVVILSNFEEEKLRAELIKEGASRFIPKNDYFIDVIMEVIDEETA